MDRDKVPDDMRKPDLFTDTVIDREAELIKGLILETLKLRTVALAIEADKPEIVKVLCKEDVPKLLFIVVTGPP